MNLSSLFSEGAVLQRGMPIPIWGNAEPSCVIQVRLADSSAFAASSASGEFLARLPEVPAGGPYTLTVENVSTGEKLEVKDILVGEVWVASGQSNMEYQMNSTPSQLTDFCAMNKTPSTLRMFTVQKNAFMARQKEPIGTWKYSDPKNVTQFSAVAAWFAYRLRETLNVPVGIIHSSWGGTIVEAWTSRNTLLRNPQLRDHILAAEQLIANSTVWDYVDLKSCASMETRLVFEKYAKKDTGNTGLAKKWAAPDFDDSTWKPFNVPGNWIQQNICENGVIWARLTIDIPKHWAGKTLSLSLGGIDKQDITYFNGIEIGRTGKDFEDCYWCTPRNYSVPAELVKSGKAVIAVRAFSFIFDGSFNGSRVLYQICLKENPEDKISLSAVWKANAEQNFGKLELPASNTPQMQGPNCPNTHSILFDGMIRPLLPYGIRGAIWYQGESNAQTIETSQNYKRKMSDLIQDWRFHWEQGDFPFLMVQLANFRTDYAYEESSTWAPLRESQRQACKELPHTGMAVITDCGDAVDIHPKDKRTVGERLAAWALHNTYFRSEIVPCGPLPTEIRKENGALRILFKHTDGGLVFKQDSVPAFRLAGIDGVFHEADSVKIEASSLVVASKAVSFPCRVRYNWADFPIGTLYNGAGFPASPFEE